MPDFRERRGFQANSEVQSSQSLVQAPGARGGLFRAIPAAAVCYAAREV